MNAMERLYQLVMIKGVLLAGLDPDIEKLLELNEQTQKFSEDDTFLRHYCLLLG